MKMDLNMHLRSVNLNQVNYVLDGDCFFTYNYMECDLLGDISIDETILAFYQKNGSYDKGIMLGNQTAFCPIPCGDSWDFDDGAMWFEDMHNSGLVNYQGDSITLKSDFKRVEIVRYDMGDSYKLKDIDYMFESMYRNHEALDVNGQLLIVSKDAFGEWHYYNIRTGQSVEVDEQNDIISIPSNFLYYQV